MKTNRVREKMRAGQPTIGCFLGLGSPNVAELLAHAGFDWLVIETEHNGLDSAEIQHMLMAINGTETVALVRIPSSNPVFIQRGLDMGALGIVVPLVKTADEARAIVSATRFPPQGTRSFGPLRASHYGMDNADYLERANDNIIVALILETREAVEDLEAIASVPGVDALYLGPFDLCLSLGLNPMHQPYPQIETIMENMVAAARKHGFAAGIGASTPEQLRQRRAEGFTLLGYGPDYYLLVEAARAGIAAFPR
ncbi:MAG: 2,4-dihydroxyhept-2-ene-1,7-dioic acid aldolase [Burkholderiales bacterium]|nr:2,4-dihydroxyhept-2-ene-1,7-dioic acid aldolase [Anaerolineae bacterium]